MDSPVGSLLLAATARGLVEIAFTRNGTRVDDALDELARKVSPRILEAPARLDPVRSQLDEYFNGHRVDFDVRLDRSLMGPFARRVLGRTERIPYGSVSTYAQVARHIGAPRAARAVGNALAANPIPVIVPCHRVVRTGGALGGYGGGLDRKEWLLDLEGARGREQ
ncbi:MAG: methylated-DNA--[protein]-cysteine S-methyltransferase [Chloroflexi bacterium]|nr:MAG: methylated-DNA--[protein]-cysteine S-methyltransferase [Chloroflexota bacterium]